MRLYVLLNTQGGPWGAQPPLQSTLLQAFPFLSTTPPVPKSNLSTAMLGYHGCCIAMFPRVCHFDRSTPSLGNGILGHIPCCLLVPSPPTALQPSLPVKYSLTSFPQAAHCICHKDSTASQSEGTNGSFYISPSFCFFL